MVAESVTEAEFLVYVLLRRKIVDELTITAVRRQFRELVRDESSSQPIESRVFESRRLFFEKVRRGQIKQRGARDAKGKREANGKVALVDLKALDGGYSEWYEHFWEPAIHAGLPPNAARNPGEFRPWNVALKGGLKSPIVLIQGLIRGPPLL